MPLTISIPDQELYDPASNRFITVQKSTVKLEYSLLSISKWESKWHKPYLSTQKKTQEESLDFLRCMSLNSEIDPHIFLALDEQNAKKIADYISDPMTATTFHEREKKSSREIITAEIIYFWMTEYNIPFDPCEKWHFNRLMTLIHVAALKNTPPKKMSKREMLNQRNLLNAQRRAKYNTRG